MKMKNDDCNYESKVGRKDVEIPPRKKLKQARLPFQILSPGVESSSPLLKNSNKRKLSESTDDIKIIKTIRPNDSSQLGETKENVCSSTLSVDCETFDNSSKALPNPCAGKDIEGHANDFAETLKICETITDLDENESGDIVKESVSKNEIDRKLKSNSSKGRASEILKTGSSDGEVDPDVIILSDSEDNIVKKDLTVSSYETMQVEKGNNLPKDEAMDKMQDIIYSPVTSNEQSETENSPVVVKNFSDELVKSEKERSLSEGCTPNSKPRVHAQMSSKSIDTKCKDCVSDTVRTPKSSLHCSPSDMNSTKAIDGARKPKTSLGDTFKQCKTQKQVSCHSYLDSTPKTRKLTPKQLQKQFESAKKKQEKERQRQEREKKKAEEKEEREKKKAEEKEEKLRQKLEKEEQKKKEKEEKEEQKRKEKEEREEQKKKEREEKERKKQVELEMKNEEKRVKDEEKRKKEDKRQAEAAAFTSFFLPKKAELKPVEEPKAKAEEKFMPFEVKADMRLAPSTRTKLTVELKQLLDQCIESQSEDQLYLDQIRSKKVIPQTSSSTWALKDFKDDIVIMDDDDISGGVTNNIVESYPTAGHLPRPKLLQFWENRRPPYWGTWRKKSQLVGPKNPFSRDEKFFDYEVDSDEEWEEEEPGESLHGSDDEKESEDEYEVDNEFFVPHGYLSDEENVGQEDEDQSPEMLKIKLKLLELEFEEEMKQKTERLKPRLIGCIWVDSKTSDCANSQLLKLLSPYQAVYRDGPIVTSVPDASGETGSPESKIQVPSPTCSSLKKKNFPEAAIPALIKLIHGNVNRREFLIKEFLAYWNKQQQQRSIEEEMGERSVEGNVSALPSFDIFKKSVSNKIKELASWVACPDGGPMSGRMCWYVSPETRAAHGLADITIPNSLWNYTFKPKRRESDIQVPSSSPVLNSESNPKQLITKFTKKMTEVERKRQFNTALTLGEMPNKRQGDGSYQHNDKIQKKSVIISSCKEMPSFKTGEEHKKKVPILMSVPNEQELHKSYKNSLMKFMKPQGSVPGEGDKIVHSFLSSDRTVVPKTQDTGGEDCIVLSD